MGTSIHHHATASVNFTVNLTESPTAAAWLRGKIAKTHEDLFRLVAPALKSLCVRDVAVARSWQEPTTVSAAIGAEHKTASV